jgi:hypothetical protein
MLDSLAARIAAGMVGVLTLLFLYLAKVNWGMKTTPPEALKYAPKRWTSEQCRAAYGRIEKKPVDWAPYLPPKLERRYIVVGGSGMPRHLLGLEGMKRIREYGNQQRQVSSAGRLCCCCLRRDTRLK